MSLTAFTRFPENPRIHFRFKQTQPSTTGNVMFNLFNSREKPVSPPSSSSPATSADADRVRKETEEALMEFYNYISKDIGCVTDDLAPIFENYEAERKKWKEMKMTTIYKQYNNKHILPLIIYFDCRMTAEEKAAIDAMTPAQVVRYAQQEDASRLSKFWDEDNNMPEQLLKGTYAEMARYWMKIRPEAWNKRVNRHVTQHKSNMKK